MSVKYTYKLRPGYSSKDLLIDLNVTSDAADQLQEDLFALLERAGFKFEATGDLWMNDELFYFFRSERGRVILSRDIWDLFFIMGENNQEDILLIDKYMLESPLFESLPVDFADYE